MEHKSLKLPARILAIGLVLALAACLFANISFAPAVTEQDFNYAVTYRLGAETKTLEGVYTCRFDGYREGENPRSRYYVGEYTVDGQTSTDQTCTIAQKDGAKLYIVTGFNDNYLMGDTKNESYRPFLDDPYLEALDSEGYLLDETNMPAEFDAEIISWEYPEPIENDLVFSGFSILHAGSMIAMLLVGLLVMVACMIFVKRDKTAPAKALDKVSAAFNFIVCLAAIPFITVATALLQITMSGDAPIYQIFLCIPAFTAFTVAASIALRRSGFTKSGFLIQFVGPILFFVPLLLESVM